MSFRQWRANGRARRGGRFFDRHAPGWFTRIDTAQLDLRTNDRCVAGQVFGGYTTPRMFAAEFGIWLTAVWAIGVWTNSEPMARALETAWRHEIAERILALDKENASASAGAPF